MKFNKLFKNLLIPLSIFALSACGSSTNDASIEAGKSGGDAEGGFEEGGSGGWFSEGDGDVTPGGYDAPSGGGEDVPGSVPEEGEEPTKPNDYTVQSGQLTCSALNDNDHYGYWKSLSESNQEGKGIYQDYKEKYDFNTFNRLVLKITNGRDIKVSLKDNSYTSHVDNFNNAYLFPELDKENYDINISYIDKDGNRQNIEKNVTNNEEIDLENESVKNEIIQLMFVIDATGSMGDEIRYIKAEVKDVIASIKEDNPNSTIQLAMMVYRDIGDKYVTKYNDFTTDIEKQQSFINEQYASGGGDFPEAVHIALSEAVDKDWSSSDATKIIIHIADAPSHDKDVDDWNVAVKKASEKGIKIITVASSGIDRMTEYCFRSQSILTGGQYVYLTNHSGIGGEHLEATREDEAVIEYLNACLVRLVNEYYTGELIEPISYYQNNQ